MSRGHDIRKVWGCMLGLLLCPLITFAGDFTWTTNSPDTNTVTITGYTGAGGDVVIPANIEGHGVTEIGDFAFNTDTNITSVIIPDSVTRIGDRNFTSCRNMTNIIFGTGVTSIGMYAFSWCHALTHLELPDSLEMTGMWSFYYSDGLQTVSVPDSLTSIGLGNFFYCKNLTSISVDSNNPSYTSVDGVLFDKAMTTLIQCPGGMSGTYVVPAGVSAIGPESFCHNLTHVILPPSIVDVGTQAFQHCLNLSHVCFEGNCPVQVGISVFSDAPTIYHMLSSVGWGPTFAERPTALWLPEAQAEGMGVQSQAFGFNIEWASGQTVVVEAATRLIEPDWVPVGTNLIVDGTTAFSDPAWTNLPGRFYRFVEP